MKVQEGPERLVEMNRSRSGETRINPIPQRPRAGRWNNLLKMSEDLGTGM